MKAYNISLLNICNKSVTKYGDKESGLHFLEKL